MLVTEISHQVQNFKIIPRTFIFVGFSVESASSRMDRATKLHWLLELVPLVLNVLVVCLLFLLCFFLCVFFFFCSCVVVLLFVFFFFWGGGGGVGFVVVVVVLVVFCGGSVF